MNIQQNEVVFSVTRDEYEYYYKNSKEPIQAFGKLWFVTNIKSELNQYTYERQYTATFMCYK